MRRKTVKISCLGTPSDYHASLVPLIMRSLGYKISWVGPIWADIVIYGSFHNPNAPRLRFLPRAWRKDVGAIVDKYQERLAARSSPPITLFHTSENLRHNYIEADFSISHDINVQSSSHFRLPYWMEMIEWSHEGIVGNINSRFGQLLKIERLQSPLGDEFLKRTQRAVLITSHLREPRASCYKTLQNIVPVDGMGPYFDKAIKNHHASNFFKRDILRKYAFNLCPENSIYPGYVTEKIPEAFSAGCLPITFVDESFAMDFNPRAILNMAPITKLNVEELRSALCMSSLRSYAHEPILLKKPSLQALVGFIKDIVSRIG